MTAMLSELKSLLGETNVLEGELGEGLGYLLLDGQMTGNAAQIVASLVLFALLGKATDSVVAALLSRRLAWRDDFGGR